MKLSLNWINEFVELKGISTEQLVKSLTLATCEVEDVLKPFGDLESLLVARIESFEKHPDADRLNICKVFDGKNTLQVICGAPNVRAGIHVMLAPVGATIGEGLHIEKRKIRGVESSGMICAPAEVGLELLFPDREGILILDDESLLLKEGLRKPEKFIGKSVAALMDLNDTVLDIDNKSITHRPDLWCHFGFAREIAAIFRKSLKQNPLLVAAPKADKSVAVPTIKIRNQAALGYSGLSVDNVAVGPSPLWLKGRLAAVGQKSINSIVDASNFVMLELAQPNHAFDRDRIADTIAIDCSKKVNKVETLDGETTEVPENSILILSEGKKSEAVAVGGIIGGSASAISDSTTRIFLESATFPRELIRRTLSRLPLRTDSAVRFEKGQDPAKMIPALYRLSEIIGALNPDAKFSKVVSDGDTKGKQNRIKISLSFVQQRLGFAIKPEEVQDTLERLHFEVSGPGLNSSGKKPGKPSGEKNSSGKAAKTSSRKANAQSKKDVARATKKSNQESPSSELEFSITAPTFRSQYDVSIPEDIIEELGRIYGYDNIPPLPPSPALIAIPENEKRSLEQRWKQSLIRGGAFYESMGYSFCSEEENNPFGGPGLRILNPVNATQGRMRLSQIPGLVKQAASNQNRFDSVRLFELGRIFTPAAAMAKDPEKNLPLESNRCTLIALPDQETILKKDAFAEFLEIRSFVESLLQAFNITVRLAQCEQKAFYLHPGCQIDLWIKDGSGQEKLLGKGGLLHPAYAARFELKRSAVLFDLDFDLLAEAVAQTSRKSFYAPPGNQPDSLFEFTAVLKKDQSTARPAEIASSLGIPEVREVALKTIYAGAPLAEDEMAVSYRVRISRKNETLSGNESQKILDAIVGALGKEGISLRS